jgi:hypothetical protein
MTVKTAENSGSLSVNTLLVSTLLESQGSLDFSDGGSGNCDGIDVMVQL